MDINAQSHLAKSRADPNVDSDQTGVISPYASQPAQGRECSVGPPLPLLATNWLNADKTASISINISKDLNITVQIHSTVDKRFHDGANGGELSGGGSSSTSRSYVKENRRIMFNFDVFMSTVVEAVIQGVRFMKDPSNAGKSVVLLNNKRPGGLSSSIVVSPTHETQSLDIRYVTIFFIFQQVKTCPIISFLSYGRYVCLYFFSLFFFRTYSLERSDMKRSQIQEELAKDTTKNIVHKLLSLNGVRLSLLEAQNMLRHLVNIDTDHTTAQNFIKATKQSQVVALTVSFPSPPPLSSSPLLPSPPLRMFTMTRV